MIVCPNCKHDNPEGATNCEACYTALPATKACPSCGASIQIDATFCGQCGHNLRSAASQSPILLPPPAMQPIESVATTLPPIGLPPTVLTDPAAEIASLSGDLAAPPPPVPVGADPDNVTTPPEIAASEPALAPAPPALVAEPANEPMATPEIDPLPSSARQLLHLQTNTRIEIPPHASIVHLGKPNDRTAPDIDVSGFPCAEVVSRIHANIRIEGESYYIEDAGSANGTYINHNVLTKGNRHLLRVGDRIGLGKGDLVTFIFQSSV